MMSSYQLVTEVWLGTKWKAKYYLPTKERLSELVTGRASALEFIVIPMIACFIVKVDRVLVKVWGCQGPTKNQVFGQCSHHVTPFGEKCGPWRVGLAGKVGALGNTRDSHLSVTSAAPHWPEQPSLSWEQKGGKPVSKPSHHWSISCSDLTMTDPCCLTALWLRLPPLLTVQRLIFRWNLLYLIKETWSHLVDVDELLNLNTVSFLLRSQIWGLEVWVSRIEKNPFLPL